MSDTHGPTRALVEQAMDAILLEAVARETSSAELFHDAAMQIVDTREAADALDAAHSQWPAGSAAAEQLAEVLSTEFDYHRWQETGETHRSIWRKIAAAVLARLNGQEGGDA